MPEIVFKQGEDRILQIPIVRDGVAVNLTNCTEIRAILKVNNQEQAKYSFTNQAGYGTARVNETTNNMLELVVERLQSKAFPIGIIRVEVLLQFTDDNFPAGVRDDEYTFQIGRVTQGFTLEEL